METCFGNAPIKRAPSPSPNTLPIDPDHPRPPPPTTPPFASTQLDLTNDLLHVR